MSDIRQPDPLTPLTSWYDKGCTHFLIGLYTPDRMATIYPTQDQWSEQDEQDFIAGWAETKRQHEAAKLGPEDFGEGLPWLEGY